MSCDIHGLLQVVSMTLPRSSVCCNGGVAAGKEIETQGHRH